jgi:DNA-binding transcriptional ArsR family regulator
MKHSTTSNELALETVQLKKAALIYRAINHKLRQQMMRLLHQNSKMIVTEIYKKLRIEQSVASQHLAILRKAQYVKTARDGKFIYYSVNLPMLKLAHKTATTMLVDKKGKAV